MIQPIRDLTNLRKRYCQKNILIAPLRTFILPISRSTIGCCVKLVGSFSILEYSSKVREAPYQILNLGGYFTEADHPMKEAPLIRPLQSSEDGIWSKRC